MIDEDDNSPSPLTNIKLQRDPLTHEAIEKWLRKNKPTIGPAARCDGSFEHWSDPKPEVKRKRSWPRKKVVEPEPFDEQTSDDVGNVDDSSKPKRKRGRPRKALTKS